MVMTRDGQQAVFLPRGPFGGAAACQDVKRHSASLRLIAACSCSQSGSRPAKCARCSEFSSAKVQLRLRSRHRVGAAGSWRGRRAAATGRLLVQSLALLPGRPGPRLFERECRLQRAPDREGACCCCHHSRITNHELGPGCLSKRGAGTTGMGLPGDPAHARAALRTAIPGTVIPLPRRRWRVFSSGHELGRARPVS